MKYCAMGKQTADAIMQNVLKVLHRVTVMVLYFKTTGVFGVTMAICYGLAQVNTH